MNVFLLIYISQNSLIVEFQKLLYKIKQPLNKNLYFPKPQNDILHIRILRLQTIFIILKMHQGTINNMHKTKTNYP